MTPEPVSPALAVATLMLTTDGETREATPAYDVGTTLSSPLGRDAAGRADGEPLPCSIAAPTPTPIPPKTRAESPAAVAVVRKPRRGACVGSSGCCGSFSSTGAVGQNRSVIAVPSEALDSQESPEGLNRI